MSRVCTIRTSTMSISEIERWSDVTGKAQDVQKGGIEGESVSTRRRLLYGFVATSLGLES